MSYFKIAKQGLRFFWKTHLATGLAVLIATAVLAGALTVGDSIRATLSRRTAMRLGRVQTVVSSPGLFRAGLAEEMEKELAFQRSRTAFANEAAVSVAAILQVTGFAENSDGTARAGRVQILGVDQRFWRMGPGDGEDITSQIDTGVGVSVALARRLSLQAGQDIVVRMRTAGGMPAEALLTQEEETRVSFRRPVGTIVEEEQFGGFDLYSRPAGGLNIYVPIRQLNELLGHKDSLWANMLLCRGAAGLAEIGQTLPKVWQLEDAGLELHLVDWPRVLELRSRDVFINDTVAERVQNHVGGSRGILTYFVNEFRREDRTVPYSFVCALEGKTDEGAFTALAPNETIINEWLANQLKASEGDTIEIRYFVPSQGKKLTEQRENLIVKSVVPMLGTGADPTLMPEIESMAESENCRDWKAGIPLDFSKIRPADEQYWDKYKGAPKAFVSMQTGKLLWSSRFGTLTAIRFSVDDYDIKTLRGRILSSIEPWQAGFAIEDVRHAGRKSAEATTDFGGLTTGLSLFLIASSLILAGLVWSFELRRRAGQMGILLAAGFTKGQAAWLFVLEQSIVILLSVLAGIAGGLFYTQLIIKGLNGIWAGATGGTKIYFAWRWQTVLMAAGISFIAACAVWLVRMRRLWRRTAAELLDRTDEMDIPGGKIKAAMRAAVLTGLAAVGLGIYGTRVSAQQAAGLFFGCGFLILIAAGMFLSGGLSYLAVQAAGVSGSLYALAVKNTARRKGRSLAISLTLAIGVFIVLSTGVFQKAGPQDATIKDSGTGGFTLWAQSSIPLVNDLSDSRNQREMGLLLSDAQPFNAVSLRFLPAEDASCLNIAQVQQPSLWGVRPGTFTGRFRFKKILDNKQSANPWEGLELNPGNNIVPAIGDWATVYWGLHKDVGDEIEYTDQSGRVFRLKIVALLDDSIWQGGLLISERQFLRRFESTSGWNTFLIDVPPPLAQEYSERLTQSLGMYGLEVQTTTDKLVQYHQVQNTYIRIFMVLGAMGLVLGTVGAGLVVLLNVLDRAGELAMMRAMGFGRRTLCMLLFLEHAGLLTAGLLLGVVSAAAAAGPQLGQVQNLPWKMMAGLVGTMWITGLIWVQIAAAAAMRGDLLEPLRKE